MLRSKFAHGYLVTIASQVFLIFVGLWTTRMVLETLGSASFGTWVICCQILSFFTLGDLGIGGNLARTIAASPLNRINQYTTTAFYMLCVLAIALAVVAILTVHLLPENLASAKPPLMWVLGIYVVTFPFRIFQSALFGLEDFAWSSALSAASVVAGLIVTIFLLKLDSGIAGPVIGWSTTQFLVLFGSLYRIYFKYPYAFISRRTRLLPSELIEELRSGMAICLWTATQVFSQAADVLFIGATLGTVVAAQYTLVCKLPHLLASLCLPLTRMSLPQLTIAYASQKMDRFRDVRLKFFYLQACLSGFTAIVVLYANRLFLDVWIGRNVIPNDFLALTPMLAAMGLVRQLSQNMATQLQSAKKLVPLAVLQLVNVFVFVLISLLLLKRLGPIAMPIAAMIAEAINLAFAGIILREDVEIAKHDNYGKLIRSWFYCFLASYVVSMVALLLMELGADSLSGATNYALLSICLLISLTLYIAPQRIAICKLYHFRSTQA